MSSYLQFNSLPLVTLVAALLLLMGCDQATQAPQGPGRVAVVDMQQIAVAAGLDQRVGQRLQEAQAQEQAQLESLQKELGLDPANPPTAEQAQSEAYQQARMRMTQAISQAQQRLQAIEFNELEQFRNMVRPIAQRVANAQGCTIVMELRDGMLSVDPVSNITDEVITELPLSTRSGAGSLGSPSAQPRSGAGPGATSQPGYPLPVQPMGQPPMMPGTQPGSGEPASPSSGTGTGSMGGYLGSEGLPTPQPAGSGTQEN